MEVQLYVYDLSRGMARTMSQRFLGIQIDAVYHTALVFGHIEYFYGMGIQTCYPGTTHHGQPMEIVPMGTTQLPADTIQEYLESLREIYTPESYDLFEHNCNNFTNDFAMFLVGKGIPDHITTLPRRVLETPFGQMLKPQLDASMRSITQAPVPSPSMAVPQRSTTVNGGAGRTPSTANNLVPQTTGIGANLGSPFGTVVNVSNLSVLESHLRSANDTASAIFFTSSTCAPCKLAYPMFDQLAERYPHALFVKVDINDAHDIARKYQIRATPTFMTFAKGTKQDTWAGADPNLLKVNVERLLLQAFPPHPHTLLKVPTLQFGSLKPIQYARVPPLEKLTAKLGTSAHDTEIQTLRSFIEKRAVEPKGAALPNLNAIGSAFRTRYMSLPVDIRFAAVDLLRCAMVDPRVSGFFAEEQGEQTIPALMRHVNELDDCPHSLRLVAIHLACNLFTSPLYTHEITRDGGVLASLLVQLIASCLLDASHSTARVASASLAFNMAAANYRIRREKGSEGLDESAQVELAASLIETLSSEENSDATKTLLSALGYLIYCAPQDGEVMDLCKALGGKEIVSSCRGQDVLKKEIVSLL